MPSTDLADPVVPERAVLAAYTGMWAAAAHAGTTPETGPGDTAAFATGSALTELTRRLAIDQRDGIRTRGQPVHAPQVLVLIPPADPQKARVRDCCDTTGWTRHDSTGQLVDADGYGRRQIDALVKIGPDGRWRVTEFVLFRVGTC